MQLRFFGRDINLSVNQPSRADLATPKPDQPVETEIGTSGGKTAYHFPGVLLQSGTRPRITDLINMRRNDGTINGLYSILTLPILANSFYFEPDPNDTNEEQAKFVEDALTLPEVRGGMSTPFTMVMADALRAVLEGYRAFEKVYKLYDNKIVYKKIASRDNQTVTILTDERGGFDGLAQSAIINNKWEVVTIPKEKAFVFTYGKDKNWLEGESAFRSAYPIYDRKHRLYYLANQQAQQAAIPPKVLTSPTGANDKTREENLTKVDQMSVRPSIALPDGWKLDFPMGNASGLNLVPLIDHYNAEMARSVLAQFVMLGTASNDRGSYALAKSDKDVFILALQGIMMLWEEHVNSFLIPDLHNFNFAQPKYCQFRFHDLTDATRAILQTAFLKIADKLPDQVPDYVIQGVADQVAEQLGIEKPEDGSGDIGNNVGGNTGDGNQPGLSRSKKKTNFAQPKWKRPLTPAEQQVNFAAIQRKFNDIDASFAQAVKPLWDKMRRDAVSRMEKLLEAQDYKSLENFDVGFGDEYRAIIVNEMMDAYVFAKNGAADELGVKIPPNSSQTKAIIKQYAQAVVDKQANDLEFEIRKTVTEALRKNQLSTDLSIGDVLSAIGLIFNSFFEEKIAVTGSIAATSAINMGRDDVFKVARNQIQSYQYSAILDEVTCPICEDLDGTVVDEADYRSTQWMPPIHPNCRCIWVAIMEDETDPPDVTGFPDSPGGADEPLLHEPYCNAVKLSLRL